jgi:hypothetical protein
MARESSSLPRQVEETRLKKASLAFRGSGLKYQEGETAMSHHIFLIVYYHERLSVIYHERLIVIRHLTLATHDTRVFAVPTAREDLVQLLEDAAPGPTGCVRLVQVTATFGVGVAIEYRVTCQQSNPPVAAQAAEQAGNKRPAASVGTISRPVLANDHPVRGPAALGGGTAMDRPHIDPMKLGHRP